MNSRDRANVSWIHMHVCFSGLSAISMRTVQAPEGELVRAYAAMARLAQQDSA